MNVVNPELDRKKKLSPTEVDGLVYYIKYTGVLKTLCFCMAPESISQGGLEINVLYMECFKADVTRTTRIR